MHQLKNSHCFLFPPKWQMEGKMIDNIQAGAHSLV
jgi:hypothetical protein